MAAPQASSRLEMLQARFQQKQLQEKEQKLLQLYDQQQQRAYQVVQRGSAGSNGSNHGSTIRTTSTHHTTSTSQGGKVRQMFDERRQTTVKGIDRSYPLEPLENKLRKPAANANGLATQRNGNLTTVNRQSVSVKRVARADVNSNVNGGKPVVSYREEVTRESFGPSVHRHDDEDEFGSENRVAAMFANGHHRHDLDNEDEALDQETVERNRMMAKIHLMGFDESLKHRVRNDLESEEFPEYLMTDVSDKLPKRSVTKKLSQAEARLERFKNANAKRSNNNNNAPKQSTGGAAVKRRTTEQALPARSNSRGSEFADGTSSGSARSGGSRACGRGNPENAKGPPPKIRAVDRPRVADKTRRESPDIETFRYRSDSPRNSPGKIGKAETTWGSYSPDNYFKSLTSDGKIIVRRGASPRFRREETERFGSIDRKSAGFRSASADRHTRETHRSTSPEFFGEGEKSFTTMTIDQRARGPTLSSLAREMLTKRKWRSDGTATNIERKYTEATRDKRSSSSQFLPEESERSDATVSIGRENMDFRSASADRQTRRSTSPEFFCREGERSATTMMIDRRGSTPSSDREMLTQRSKQIEESATSIDRKYAEITRDKRSSSSPLFFKEFGKSDATVSSDPKGINVTSTSVDRQTRTDRSASRSTSPEFFCREGERSATTMLIDRSGSTSSRGRKILTQQSSRAKGTVSSIDRKYTEAARDKRSSSPRFLLKDSEKSDTTVSIGRKSMDFRSASADRQTRETRRSTSPEFFRREGERSATTVMIGRGGSTSSRDREVLTQQSKRTEKTASSIDRKYSEVTRDKRSSSPRFLLKDSEKSDTTVSIGRKSMDFRSASADRQTRETRRSTSPEFFRRKGERSATTVMIGRGGSTSSREILTQRSSRAKGTTSSIDRKYTEATRDKRSSGSPFFLKQSGKPGATVSVDRRDIDFTSADRETRETRRSRSTSPEFFCKEGERSATTMLIDRRGSISSRDREILTQRSSRAKEATSSIDRKHTEATRDKRSSSSAFFLKELGKSDATVNIDRKNIDLRSASADRQTRADRSASRSTSPEFFCREGERSATTMLIDRSGSTPSRGGQVVLAQQSSRAKGATSSIDRKHTEATRDKRSSSSAFFLKELGKSDATVNIDRKNIDLRSASADRQTRADQSASRSTSPEFFCREGERSATTMLIDRSGSTPSRGGQVVLAQQGSRAKGATSNIERKHTEATRDKRFSSPQFFRKRSERSTTMTLIERKSSPTDSAKGILKPRKYASDTFYKQSVTKPSLPGVKGVRSTRVRHSPSPQVAKSAARKSMKSDEASGVIVRSDSRRSSKISSSASSIVSLKYGLEFDNILQSAGLVRKFMKSQNGAQRDARRLQSPWKRNIKANAQTVRDCPPRKNRYGVSPIFRNSRSPSTDSRERATPEYSRKSITPTEIDVEIQEITMTDHRMERRKSSSPEQSTKDRAIDDAHGLLTTSRKISSPTRDCGRRHETKSNITPRFSPLGKAVRRGLRYPDIPRTTSSSRRVADPKSGRTFASKYATYTVKDRKRESLSAAKKADQNYSSKYATYTVKDRRRGGASARKSSPLLSDDKAHEEARSKSEESRDAAAGFSKATSTQREDASASGIGRIEPSSAQESRRFDSVGSAGSSERSAQASPEISLRTMDVRTNVSVERLSASAGSTVTRDTTLRSASRTSTSKSPRVGNAARKRNLGAIPSKEIRSSRRITKTYRSAIGNKPESTQRRSPMCKRQLFDSEKEVHEKRTNWSFARTRQTEDRFSARIVRSHADEATSMVKSLESLDVAQKSTSAEVPTIAVKPLRSIEDIRRSIGHHERSPSTAAKRSRSAIANWRSSTPREGGGARRSSSASGAARRVPPEDESARLTKVQSCVSRIAKSPSPDASARKQHETNARATRGSAPSSPSKSPDMHVAPRRGSTEPKNQDARPARRPVVAKAAESVGSKTTTGEVDTVDGVVQENGSPHESSAKKPDAFVSDDRPKESDTTPSKKVTLMRRSSNDKYQATSSASGRPTSSVSSNFSSAGTTQSQASSTKSRMAARAKTPVSGGSQAKGLTSARNAGNTNSADNLSTCNICGRNFAQDRIGLHERICAKTMNKKRKQFDAMMFRVKGTELEPFVKKGVAKKQEVHAKKPELKSNWRRKHEEFIEAIRSAKMVQSHLAAGGSLKDLPPPPPSDTSDYIQCPHCGRRFNQAAAERHIPKCEHMLHNKPAHARAAKTRR